MQGILTFSTVVFAFGAIIGSFLTACIYRIPLGKYDAVKEVPSPPGIESATLLEPRRSFCPNCGNQLKWWHNIPIISWLILRGGCGFCGNKIPLRYPLVELITASSALLCLLRFGPTSTALLIFIFVAALIVITFVDLDYMIIPDVISLPGTTLGLIVGIVQQFTNSHTFLSPVVDGTFSSLLGILMGGGFLYLVSEVYLRLRKIDGLGMGDVKLLAMIGAFFGPRCAFFTILASSLVALAVMIPAVVFSKHGLKQHLPFGPYIAFAAFLFIFFFTNAFLPFSEPVSWWISDVFTYNNLFIGS